MSDRVCHLVNTHQRWWSYKTESVETLIMGPEHLQISLSKVGPVTNPLQMLRDDYASVWKFALLVRILSVSIIMDLYLAMVSFSVQFSSVAQSCPTLWDPMNYSIPGLPVHHQLPEFTQTPVCWVGDAVQPSHPLSSPCPPAPKSLPASETFPMSQLFTWGGQVLEFQL